MKRFMSTLVLSTLVVAMAVPTFASSFDRPVEVYADLAGMTVVEAWEEMRESDMTFGELAETNGFGDEFQATIKEVHEDRIEELLEAGVLTEEEAEAAYEQFEDCDGVPGAREGTHALGYGEGFGLRDGTGYGRGQGRGHGVRDGSGFGHHLGDE